VKYRASPSAARRCAQPDRGDAAAPEINAEDIEIAELALRRLAWRYRGCARRAIECEEEAYRMKKAHELRWAGVVTVQ
jgi:hypothetical protein